MLIVQLQEFTDVLEQSLTEYKLFFFFFFFFF
jgi:hypothetical protein